MSEGQVRKVKLKVYNALVNRVPVIREKYHEYHDSGTHPSVFSWGYLLWLKFSYYVLHSKSLRKQGTELSGKRLYSKDSESSLSVREAPEVLAERLAEYDVVSFDVFDTLVFRTCSEPTNVFFRVEKETGYFDFGRLRRESEEGARQELYKKKKSREVNLSEIYAYMEQETGMSMEEAKKEELLTEKKSCFANSYMFAVVQELRRLKKRIIITSDMYLPEEFIKELLIHTGYEEFDAYYVSNEYSASKSEGTLYESVKKAEQEQAGKELRFVHIGDNPFSDITQARKHGFEAVHYKNVNETGNVYRTEDMSLFTGSMYRGLVNAKLHCGLKKYTIPYEFGYVYGGLFVTGYCRFIHRICKEKGIEKILFLARDGDVLQKAYKVLYPGERTEYVYWSRKAAAKVSAGQYRRDYFRRFLYHKVNQDITLEEIFQSMELDNMLERYCKERKAVPGNVLTDQNIEKVKSFFVKHWSEVTEHYRPQTDAARAYYRELLHGTRKAVAVDIGWAGSGALLLNHMVNREWGMECDITGIIAGTNSANDYDRDISTAQLESGRLACYLYSQKENRDIWRFHDAVKNHNLYWELLLGSAEPSFQGFYPDGKGGFFLRFKYGVSHEKEIGEIHAGILDFVEDWIKAEGEEECEISGRDAYAAMWMVEQEKNREYVKRLENLLDVMEI